LTVSQNVISPNGSPQSCQRPAQSGSEVVGPFKEEIYQVLAAVGNPRHQQVGQQGQRPAAGDVDGVAITADLGETQQMEVKRYGCPPSGTDDEESWPAIDAPSTVHHLSSIKRFSHLF